MPLTQIRKDSTRTTLENTVLGKRRIQYEEELSHDRRNYDAWFDYARLEEGAYLDVKEEGATSDELDASVGRIREVYERAVAQVPPGGEKCHWRRYIFLWLDYALFEEIETKVSEVLIYLILWLGLFKHKNNVSRTILGHGRSTKQQFL
jgi:crooked neck